MGTSVYGTPCGMKCPQEWSIRFDNQVFNQFLFASGDETKWLIADKEQVIGGYYNNEKRTILKSSSNNNSYQAKWYHRSSYTYDPLISLVDFHTARQRGGILYVGDGNNAAVNTKFLVEQGGADVFIRKSEYYTNLLYSLTASLDEICIGFH